MKCAPDVPPKAEIKANRIAPVAAVLASRAIATLPPPTVLP